MSCRFRLFLAVLILFSGITLGADELALTPEQQDVWKISQLRVDALNHRDADTFARYTDDNYIGSTDDGVFVTKAAAVKRLSRPPEYDQRKDIHDVKVQADGDTGVVNYLVTLDEGFGTTRILVYLRRTEVYKKKNGKWVAIAAHESALPVNFHKPIKADPETFKDYVGQYAWPRPGMLDIYTIENGRLMSEWNGHKAETFPMANDTFFVSNDVGWTTFERDAQARVTGYIYHFPDGQEITTKKIN